MSVSHKMRAFAEKSSWIRKMFEEGALLRQQYGDENVFDFTLGNPTTEPPAELHRELKQIAENPIPGMHRYMNNAGYEATRAAGIVASPWRHSLDIEIEKAIARCTLKRIPITCQ